MSTFLKVALAMLLTLPLGAYITGTLVASQVDMPVERAPVVIEGRPSESPASTPTSRPSPTRSPDDDDRKDDRDDDHRGRGGGDDDVRVVRPTPREVDDDYLEDRADEREDRADDREDRTDDSDDGADDD